MRGLAGSATRRLIKKGAGAVAAEHRWSPTTKIGQRHLVEQWKHAVAERRPPRLSETGFRVFSQFEEDGLLLFVFTAIGTGTRTFVDIGAADGVNSNCANLAVNHGWDGLFVEGNTDLVARGEDFYANHPDTWAWPPRFASAMVKRDNVNEIVSQAGFKGEIDLLSIDIDGNDYWVWDALTAVQPRVVIIETHVEFGSRNIVVPYDAEYAYPGEHPDYHGASVVAMRDLARQLGYRLVGANAYGFNTIYVRGGDGADILPEVSPESVLAHPRNRERALRFDEIRDRTYVKGGTGFPGEPARAEDGLR